MKKFIYISVMILMVVSFIGIARAEDGSNEQERETKVQRDGKLFGRWFKDIRDAREEKRNTIEDMRDSRKELFDDRKSDIDAGREAIKDASDDDRPGLIEEQKEKREEFKEEIKDKTKEIIEARVKFAATLYTMTIERLQQIADRISSRIDKLVAEGKDMTSAKASLVEARTHIEKAQTAANEIKLALESLTDKSGFFQANREKIAEIRSELKLAHQALLTAVKAMKPIVSERKSSATE